MNGQCDHDWSTEAHKLFRCESCGVLGKLPGHYDQLKKSTRIRLCTCDAEVNDRPCHKPAVECQEENGQRAYRCQHHLKRGKEEL